MDLGYSLGPVTGGAAYAGGTKPGDRLKARLEAKYGTNLLVGFTEAPTERRTAEVTQVAKQKIHQSGSNDTVPAAMGSPEGSRSRNQSPEDGQEQKVSEEKKNAPPPKRVFVPLDRFPLFLLEDVEYGEEIKTTQRVEQVPIFENIQRVVQGIVHIHGKPHWVKQFVTERVQVGTETRVYTHQEFVPGYYVTEGQE